MRAAAEEKVGRLSHHHDGWEHAEVHFIEERNPRISAKEVCEATMRGHGRIIRAKAASADSLTSLDRVVDKLEHQIDKLKSRHLSRPHPKPPQTTPPPPGAARVAAGAPAPPRGGGGGARPGRGGRGCGRKGARYRGDGDM